MRIKLFVIFVAFIIGVIHVHAQTGTPKSATVLNAEVNSQLPDQNVGQITPYNLRQTTLDMIASSVLGQSTAPTIASGFCSTASNTSISASNGTAAFDILIGGATCGSTGTLTMAAAATGWACQAADVTTPATHDVVQTRTQGSTTAVVLTDYARVAGTAQNFNPADHIHVMCTGY